MFTGVADTETAAPSSVPETAAPEDPAESETESPISDEEDLELATFRSLASTVQMEITTGLTTEYLDSLCLYPLKIYRDGEVLTVRDFDELDKLGLDYLYTEELKEAVANYDPDTLTLTDGRAIVGNPETAYVVLGKMDPGLSGIIEFHYN